MMKKRQTSLTEFVTQSPAKKMKTDNDFKDDYGDEIKEGCSLLLDEDKTGLKSSCTKKKKEGEKGEANKNEKVEEIVIDDQEDDEVEEEVEKKENKDNDDKENTIIIDEVEEKKEEEKKKEGTKEEKDDEEEEEEETETEEDNEETEDEKETEENDNNIKETEEDNKSQKFVKLPPNEVYKILRDYKAETKPKTLPNLIRVIKNINVKTRNYRGKVLMEYDGLKTHFKSYKGKKKEHFFNDLLPKILDAALRLPELYETVGPLPIVPANTRGRIELTQSYAASVVANMFFCAFKKEPNTEYLLEPNFQLIYHSESYISKLPFFVHYFERVLLSPKEGGGKDTLIVYERRNEAEPPNWEASEKQLCSVEFTDEVIEDAGPEYLKTDFANRCLGGGVMAHGMVQEEIMFLEAPELLPVRLCFPPLLANESAVLMGAEHYSNHVGYGFNTEFAGDFVDTTEIGEDNIRKTVIVAIDAVHYRSFESQFTRGMIRRELFKAYV